GRTVEVLELPGNIDEELLYLYFENKRRSGGGPLESVEIKQNCAVLRFEDAEAAARVLSKGHHVVHNSELSVRKPPSKDRCRLLLRGVSPYTSTEMIELYVENMMDLKVTDYTLIPSPEKGFVLIHLSQPLSKVDFQTLRTRISKRKLDGSEVTLEQIEQTDSVLLENMHPGTSPDLLRLYFESEQGGNQRVKEVTMLSEGTAKVTFAYYESVDCVLRLQHKVNDTELVVKAYFDFLQPATQDSVTESQDVTDTDSVEVENVDMQTSPLPVDAEPSPPAGTPHRSQEPPAANVVEVEEAVMEDQTVEIEAHSCHIPVTDRIKLAWYRKNNIQQDVQKAHPSFSIQIKDDTVHVSGPNKLELEQIKDLISRFFGSIAETRFTVGPETLGYTSTKSSERPGSVDILTLKGMENDKQAAIMQFLTTPIEREALLTMEPGMLKYIQIHCHQLLADMDQVSIFPLEGEENCGLKIHGQAVACQMAEEVLQGVVSSVCTRIITVNVPGVCRFLDEKECRSILNEMETKFQSCFCGKNQSEADQDVLRGVSAYQKLQFLLWFFNSFTLTLIFQTDSIHTQSDYSIDIIQIPLCSRTFLKFDDMDNLDLYTAEEPSALADQDVTDVQSPQPLSDQNVPSSSLEEEAQLSLAIQYSMEANQWSQQDEEEQFQKALELSKKMTREEHSNSPSGNSQQLHVFAGYSCDLIRVDIAFNKKVNQRQVEEKVEHRTVKNMTNYHAKCLEVIKRKHAVDVQVQGTIIAVSGFKDYVTAAISDVKLLLENISNAVSDKEILKTVQTEEEYSLLSHLPDATKIDEESEEFQEVVKNFYSTIQEYHSKIRIIQVEKLMNRLLYNQYKLKKASVLQHSTQPIVERVLYHGTSEGSVKEICVHGFNRSFCGKNATVYGQGVYFAVNSALSVQDQYSPPNADGYKFIFASKVLTGDFTKGCHSMKTAPLKETENIPLRYDSVTDDITKPTMFVIFNDTQAFPEYLITCQRIYR
uniref:Poly [ADP-ribose] polymerase n=1 Tax=Poecilia formosa TaxID=48698 RepID=A0A096LU65_POEFO